MPFKPPTSGGTFTGGTVPDATTFESNVDFDEQAHFSNGVNLDFEIGSNGTSSYGAFIKAESTPGSGVYYPLYAGFNVLPGNGETGFLSGGFFVVGNGTTANLFFNQGSGTSADFKHVETAAVTASTQSLSAGTTVSVEQTDRTILFTGATPGGVTLTSTPQVAAGSYAGHRITLFNNGADPVRFIDESSSAGSNLRLSGSGDVILTKFSNLTLEWDAANSQWFEVARMVQ